MRNNNRNKHDELIRHPIALPPTDANGNDTGEDSKMILQDDASYPEGWNVEEFKNLGSYAARGRYAKEKLGKLGAGSSRLVFEIDNNTVLKLARNKKGLAQNELEAEISALGWYDFVAKVYDYDQNNLWIESEKAGKISKGKFKQLTGFRFEDFANHLMNKFNNRKNSWIHPIDKEVADRLDDDEFFNGVVGFIADYDILPGDIARLSSWGYTNRNGSEEPVLIDYGVSNTIYKDFYVKKNQY